MDNFLDDESICKLCLNFINDEYFIIDSLIVQKLQAFCSNESSTIKFTQLKDFLMCYTCSKLLQKLDNLQYKDSKTIQRENTILVENKHSLENYSENNLSSSQRYPENACNVCCGFIIDKYHVISNDGIQMFDNLGVSVSSGSKVCQECFDSIYELNNFKVAFIDIQNFIRAYCETFDISDESELNLSHVKFCKTYSHHLDQLDACSEDNSIKIEENNLEESNAENFNIYSSVVGDLENHLKYHDEFHEKVEYGSSECAYKSESLESQKNHSACHIEEDIDSDQYSFKSTMNRTVDLHSLMHHKHEEVAMFECHICDYKAKQKGNLKTHLLIHEKPADLKMFKCHICDYKAKQKGILKTHLLIHEKPEDLKMFKCHICEYQAKQKGILKTHLLIHEWPENIKMFECHICEFQAKQKGILKTHLLTHQKPEDIKMFECHVCKYRAKQKGTLKAHLRTHQKPEDIKMFKCECCSYQSKKKYSLRRHFLKQHSKDHVSALLFNCHLCEYKTMKKKCWKTHLLKIHRNAKSNLE